MCCNTWPSELEGQGLIHAISHFLALCFIKRSYDKEEFDTDSLFLGLFKSLNKILYSVILRLKVFVFMMNGLSNVIFCMKSVLFWLLIIVFGLARLISLPFLWSIHNYFMSWLTFTSNEYFQSLVLLNIENHNVGKCKHEFATFTI